MIPKISIIITTYNIDKYINRCINSIVNQSFKDFEVIIVDDGSTDRTRVLLNKIKNKLDMIKIIYTKNLGPNGARQKGFLIAKGEYILFVDGDDWIEDNTLEILYKKICEFDYDIIGFKYILYYDDMNKKTSEEKDFKYLENDEYLKETLKCNIIPSMWSKLIKKDFIVKNNINFKTDILCAEDLVFTCELGMYNPKACVLENKLYYYFQRSNSISNTITSKLLDVDKATNYIKDMLIERNILHQNIDEFEYLCFIHNYYMRVKIMYEDIEIGKILYKQWKKKKINVFSNPYCIKWYTNDTFKAKLLSKMIQKNYYLGILYYKLIRKKENLSLNKN